MISVEEALEKILSSVHVLSSEEKPILECLGQVLDADVIAGINIPPHDNSAMDGYAVRATDTQSAGTSQPVYLSIMGEAAAGHISSLKVETGTAIRIMTGAPLPDGANAVVQFEDTDELAQKNGGKKLSRIGILKPATPGLNIRLKGEDIKAGNCVLKKGSWLRPAEIGLLASLGKARVTVVRRPVISILSTGDELCDIAQPLVAGKIYDSNAYSIAANVMNCGAIPQMLGISKDSIESLNEKIDAGLTADMLITSGGVSMGDYDIVKDVLAQRGNIGFWTVRMKPGKPLAFGLLDGGKKGATRKVPHLGLPGNPVSSMITFEQFVRPAILKMMGKDNYNRPVISAKIDRDIINDDGRRIFTRVRVTRQADGWGASVTGPQGSGILSSMSAANGLAIVPEDCPLIRAGSLIKVQLLDSREEII